MSELAALMVVFGAVDDAVVENPRLRPTVAALLPAYHHGATGWYDWGLRWARRARGSGPAPPQHPTATEGLEKLTGNDADPVVAYDRLLAAAVVSRVRDAQPGMPTLIGPRRSADPDADLVDALLPLVGTTSTVSSVSGSSPLSPADQRRAKAGELIDLLRDTRRYPDFSSFPALTAEAHRRGLLAEGVARHVASPCTWSVIPAGAGQGPSVAFETRFRIQKAQFADLEKILIPKDWGTYKPPWCSMTRLGRGTGDKGHMRFVETVAPDCEDPPAFPLLGVFALKTVLDFNRTDLPAGTGGQALEYRLAADQRRGDGLVTVDEGSLVLWQQGDRLHVITTKRIQFRLLESMSDQTAARLAQLVWNLGYVTLVERFIHSVATQKGYVVQVERNRHRRRSGPPSRSGAADARSGLDAAVAECKDGLRTSLAKVAAGNYGPADYLGDLSKVSSHLTQHGSRLLHSGAAMLVGNDQDG